MKFLHITDIHFLREYPKAESGYLSIFNEMTSPIEQLKQGLKAIELREIEAVLVTGDLTECGDEGDYKQLKADLKALFGEIPMIVTLGNHDHKPAFYKGWLGVEPSHKPYHTITQIQDVAIIGLDISDEEKQDGLITKEHCEWLEEALEDVKGTQTILMMHHHLLPEQADTPPAPYDEAFYKLIEKSQITAILCGHAHHSYTGQFAGKDYFTADNLSFRGIDEGDGVVRFEEYSGFNTYILEGNKLEVRKVPAVTDKRLLAKVKFR